MGKRKEKRVHADLRRKKTQNTADKKKNDKGSGVRIAGKKIKTGGRIASKKKADQDGPNTLKACGGDSREERKNQGGVAGRKRLRVNRLIVKKKACGGNSCEGKKITGGRGARSRGELELTTPGKLTLV